jgi:hypothetical protein
LSVARLLCPDSSEQEKIQRSSFPVPDMITVG